MGDPGGRGSPSLIEAGRVLAQRFRADVLLGRGGMGEVWRCHDLDQARNVAVKVVRPEVTAEPWAARLFHGEVMAMARLAHPACIPIYDFLDEPELGSFFVMEYRPGGRPLRELVEAPPPWPVLHALFDEILAGLAYAHAKGVMHLDIKPENVLVQARGRGLRPTILDFGISRVRQAGEGIERWTQGGEVLGTVSYMAPEQLSGEVGRIGRWTDLYALGTMIYELVAGRLPFHGDDPVSVLLARLTTSPPPLVPRSGYAVPERFCALVGELLASEPHERPRFAADVRAALRAIAAEEPGDGEPPSPAALTASSAGIVRPAAAPHSVLSGDPLLLWLRTPEQRDAAPSPAGPTAATRVVKSGPEALAHAHTLLAISTGVPWSRSAGTALGPRFARETVDLDPTGPQATPPARRSPATTSTGPAPPAVPRLASSGAVRSVGGVADPELIARTDEEPPAAGSYGLYGLRDLPLLGRFSERQATWEVVRDAFAAGLPRVVILEGLAGVGKSRLARDVIERGEQLGLLEGMQTWWSAGGSADEGLRGLLENTIDCRGGDVLRVQDQLAFWLAGIEGDHHYFARDARVFLRPPPGVELDRGLPLRVAVELIERGAERRPVLLWLDDVQWGREEALPLIQKLLSHTPPLPVCVVGSVRSDEPAPPGWDALVAHDRARRVPMAQLDLEATRVFVRGLLDVDDELCHLIAGRAEGNPLFAAQLLHQLVEADALERREGRYGLSKDFDLAQVPANIEALWEQRVARAVPAEPERVALGTMALVRGRLSGELAAALEAAAGDDRASFAAARRSALAAGLAREEEGTFAWAHGLLREHLARSLPAAARRLAHLRAATALEALRDTGEDVDFERAHHLRAAGEDEGAVQALRAAVDYCRARSRMTDLLTRAELLLACSGTLELAEPGRHRALALVHLGRLDHLQGRLEESERKLDEALRLAGPEERLQALNQSAKLLWRAGRVEEVLAAYDALEKEGKLLGDRSAEGRALLGKADQMVSLGRGEEAAPLFAGAREAFAASKDERLVAYVGRGQGHLALQRSDMVQAGAHFTEAHEIVARLGDAQGELLLDMDLSSWHQARGDLEATISHMRRALRLAEGMGMAYLTSFARVNLASAEAARGNHPAALEHLRAAEQIEGGLRSGDVRTGHAYLSVEVSASRDSDVAVRAALGRAIDAQRASGFLDPDFPRSLERAAALAAAQGLSSLPGPLLDEARRLWDGLGRPAEIDRLDGERRLT